MHRQGGGVRAAIHRVVRSSVLGFANQGAIGRLRGRASAGAKQWKAASQHQALRNLMVALRTLAQVETIEWLKTAILSKNVQGLQD